MKSKHPALPYPPSWIDRFTDWVEKLPGPWWFFYVVMALAFVLFQAALQWQAGKYPIGTFDPFHVWFMVDMPYFLALMHYLDRSAEAALKTSRPSLNVNEAEYADLRYRLTHLPARPTFAASSVTAAFIILVVILLGEGANVGAESMRLSSTPISLTFGIIFWALTCWILGAFFYQVPHQLRMISRIYSTYARIDFFQLTPLYAFSGVVARLAVALVLQNFLWQVTFPREADVGTMVNIAMGSFMALLAIVVFALPLLGLHRQLEAEKMRILNENGKRLETVAAALHRDVDGDNLENSTRLITALTGLEIERKLVREVPTWPWQPETLRGLITALFLPVVAFLIQYLMQRFFY